MAVPKSENRLRAEQLVAQSLDSAATDWTRTCDALSREHPELEEDLRVIHEEGPTPDHRRYERRDEVARGGMGAIYEAWDRNLARLLAMKVNLRSDRPVASARFTAEAHITAQLDHPGIVPVHDLGRDSDGRAWFTMKLVRGETLGRVFRHAREGREGWTRARVLGVLQKMCEALAYAHSKGVVHRDLKPGNVMVGEFGEVYVMDWGLAKILGDPPDAESAHSGVGLSQPESGSPLSGMTAVGTIVGTPAYMPPEQAHGDAGQVDVRTDIYAAGAMLYELLAGEVPYVRISDSSSPEEIWHAVKSGPPPAIRELNRAVPPELEAICEKAMARDPGKRYADMRELADDLRAFQENRVVGAWRTGPWIEFRKWVSRNRALAATAAGALVVVLALATGTSVVLAAKNHAITAARDETRGINEFILEEVLFGVHPEKALGREITVREALENAERRIEVQEVPPGVAAAVREALGESFWKLALLDPSAKQFRQAVQLLSELDGPDARPTLRAKERLARVLTKRGDVDEAEQLTGEIRAVRVARLGPDHQDTLRSDYQIAGIARARGEYAEAEELFRRNLEARKRVLGEDDVATLNSLNQLAQMIERQGRVEEALALHEEAVERSRHVLGPEHPEALVPAMDLASALQDLNRFDEAEALYREVIEIQARVLGEDHLGQYSALNNLATLVEMLGRFDEAEDYYMQALELLTNGLSDDHPKVALVWANLGGLAIRQGKYDLGEERLLRALEIQRAELGPQHPETLASGYNLAMVDVGRGQCERAVRRIEELLPAAVETLGADNWNLGNYHVVLGHCLTRLERYERAEREIRAAERLFVEGLGEDHGLVGGVRRMLAELEQARDGT